MNGSIGLYLIALQREQSLFELFAIRVDDDIFVENVIDRVERRSNTKRWMLQKSYRVRRASLESPSTPRQGRLSS
jgi:hypothetical protein